MHFMGIGGQGISAVAQMVHAAGQQVSGCDQQASATVRALQQVGIPVQVGHSPEHLAGVDTLVISPAVPALDPYNAELVAARERGLKVMTWQELLGGLLQDKCVLSVSGVHGKGTTTSMLSLALVDAGLDPTCEIGAVVPHFGANYRIGKSQYFVNEADEFNHNFWHYHPRLAIVTSIEFEHPEFFASYDAFLDAFEHFIRGMDMERAWPIAPTLIVNQDSPGCFDLLDRLRDWHGQVVAYGINLQASSQEGSDDVSSPTSYVTKPIFKGSNRNYQANFEAYDVRLEGETSFRVRLNGRDLLEGKNVQLQLPGLHNVQNALAAFAAAATLGVDGDVIAQSLASFTGNRRRFEIRYQGPLYIDGQPIDVMLVDDYAHHPTAIAATLEAARQRYPGRRLVAVYQPHMYSRTITFLEQFVHAFNDADVAIIADIFPARERDTGVIHARDLVARMALEMHFLRSGGASVLYGGNMQATEKTLRRELRTGDLVIIMGAGDIYTVTESLLQAREQHEV